MKLNDVITEGGAYHAWNDDNITYQGFELVQWEDHEEDNTKLFHEVKVPGQSKVVLLDFSPYEKITPKMFQLMVEFYKATKRFPNRDDIPSIGSVRNEDIPKIFRKLILGQIK